MSLKCGKIIALMALTALPFGSLAKGPEISEQIMASLTGEGTQAQKKIVSKLVEFIYEAAKDPTRINFESASLVSGGKLTLGTCHFLDSSYRRCSYSFKDWSPHDSHINYLFTDTKEVESDKGVSIGVGIDTSTVCLNRATLSKLWGITPEEINMPLGDFFGPESEKEDKVKRQAEIYKNVNPKNKFIHIRTYLIDDCISSLTIEAPNP